MRSVLVANRGEIAARVFRAARAMGLRTVGVFSDTDADLPFVAAADESVRLPGDAPAETYLRGDLIIAAALRAGADSIHPGYGFLAENASFAREVVAAGLTWVGPPPEAIEAMGSKLRAKRLMSEAGVATLPWTDDVDSAGDIGYPLLVKASAGGGGRGMRIVRGPEGLAEAVDGARREAAGAFGDDTVFFERYLERARHIEVQVFLDTQGNAVSLFERECSIQRRHQKVVEEAPSPFVGDALRAELGAAALTAAKAVGYVGAGTVEFVVAGDAFYFLEMNTRLQVEHPVTELVTGLDLVRLQLMVAAGQPLPAEALSPRISGHAIEVRLYAEDPDNGYLPSIGRLRRFEIPDGVRVDSGVESGSVVSPHYDAMLAKVVAHAATRHEAAATLATALRGSRIHGVRTNRDLLVRILGEEDFLAGATDTSFLETHEAVLRGAGTGSVAHAVAAAMARQARNRARAGVWASLPTGWRNNPSQSQQVELAARELSQVVRYQFGRDGCLALDVDGELVAVIVHTATPTLVDADIDGVRRQYEVAIAEHDEVIDVDSSLGCSSYSVVARFGDPAELVAAGSLVAPMPGSVVRVLVETGDAVRKGQGLIVLEAMKMEHTVVSPADGSVTDLRVSAGEQVDAGSLLAVVEAD